MRPLLLLLVVAARPCIAWAADHHRTAPAVRSGHAREAAGAPEEKEEQVHAAGRGVPEEAGEEAAAEGAEGEELGPVDVSVGAMLLGTVTFVMLLFQLVNIADDDVRRYAWKVISNTISIFMAVLFFQGNNQILSKIMDSADVRHSLVVVTHFVHCCVYLVALLLSMAVPSPGEAELLDKEDWMVADSMLVSFETIVPATKVRAVTNHLLNVKKSVYIDAYNMEVPVVRKKVTLEKWKRNMKAWSTLWAHMAGFAAIAAGASMQHNWLFIGSPALTLVPVLVTTTVLLLLFKGTSLYRTRQQAGTERKDADGGADAQLLVQEFAEEAENEILNLTVSFLTVQVVRYAITGQLPDASGVESSTHGLLWGQIYTIWGVGLAFIVGSMLLVRLDIYLETLAERSEERPGAASRSSWYERVGARVAKVLMNTCAMCFAWCMMWGARWAFMLEIGVFGTSAHSVMGRIELAMMLSMVAFIVVYLLDKVDDSLALARVDGQGAAAAAAAAGAAKIAARIISATVEAISVLVGFTWEHSFDGAVTAIANLSHHNPHLVKFVLGVITFSCLLRPWRKYILKRAMQLEELKEDREAASGELAALSGVPLSERSSELCSSQRPLILAEHE